MSLRLPCQEDIGGTCAAIPTRGGAEGEHSRALGQPLIDALFEDGLLFGRALALAVDEAHAAQTSALGVVEKSRQGTTRLFDAIAMQIKAGLGYDEPSLQVVKDAMLDAGSAELQHGRSLREDIDEFPEGLGFFRLFHEHWSGLGGLGVGQIGVQGLDIPHGFAKEVPVRGLRA